MDNRTQRNALYRLASIGGVLLGLFLIAAANGHLSAVWPDIDSGMSASGNSRLVLLLPGLILATIGLINIAICRAMWTGMSWALHLALTTNVLVVMYFAFLLLEQRVPNHPIGHFVATMSSYIILLCSIRVGLIWPGHADAGLDRR